MQKLLFLFLIFILAFGCIEPIVEEQNQSHQLPKINKSNTTYLQNPLVDSGQVVLTSNIEYANVDGTSLLLDIYTPVNITEKLPLIVWIHGGAWTTGSKNDVISSAASISNGGYVVASIDYRFSQDEIFPAQIHDVKAAIRWLRANEAKYNYTTEKIGVIGSSAGGHLASLLGTSGDVEELEGNIGGNLGYSSKVQAVVDLYGPVNLVTLTGDCSGICYMDHDSPTSPESNLIGCQLSQCLDKAKAASATNYISVDDPPFLIIHGDQDGTVAPAQSENFYANLTNAGVEAKFMVAEGYDHTRAIATAYKQEILIFFDKYLKNST
ncbi:MAG: alpha/beta hydrolase [Candidatus Micrarchaeota archaeon]